MKESNLVGAASLERKLRDLESDLEILEEFFDKIQGIRIGLSISPEVATRETGWGDFRIRSFLHAPGPAHASVLKALKEGLRAELESTVNQLVELGVDVSQ